MPALHAPIHGTYGTRVHLNLQHSKNQTKSNGAVWVQVDHSSQKPGHQNPLPESFSDFSAKISELSLGRSKIDNDDSGKRRFHSGKNR